MAVSVPFRLDQCADRIGLGFSRVYQRHFMREMVAYVRDKQRLFAHQGMADRLSVLEQLGPLDGLRTFWDFDGRITAPLHGYADADDYYRRASSRFFLGAIRVPTLLIQSADDPFVFRHSVPEAHELSASTRLELHDKGVTWASSAARRASPTTTWNGASPPGWPRCRADRPAPGQRQPSGGTTCSSGTNNRAWSAATASRQPSVT